MKVGLLFLFFVFLFFFFGGADVCRVASVAAGVDVSLTGDRRKV